MQESGIYLVQWKCGESLILMQYVIANPSLLLSSMLIISNIPLCPHQRTLAQREVGNPKQTENHQRS